MSGGTFTREKFDAMRRDFNAALGPRHPFGGVKIVVNPHHPVVPDGFDERRYAAHPLVVWLHRWINRALGLSLDPDIVVKVQRWKDGPMLHAGGVIYCSAAQFDAIKKSVSNA